ncbi:uncharacterized protein UDID_19102 [Ustilago sp. UG-2017a]|nr:uncharacterized protein UDID_19102 [Ustilago sp. UG-2017a]
MANLARPSPLQVRQAAALSPWKAPIPVIDDKQRSREAEGRHPNEKTPFDAEEEKRRKRTVGDVREKRARQEIGRAGSEDAGSEDAGAKPFLLSGLVSMKPLLLRKEKWSACLVLCADPRQVGPSDGGKGSARWRECKKKEASVPQKPSLDSPRSQKICVGLNAQSSSKGCNSPMPCPCNEKDESVGTSWERRGNVDLACSPWLGLLNTRRKDPSGQDASFQHAVQACECERKRLVSHCECMPAKLGGGKLQLR